MEDTEAVAVEISFCEKNKKERRKKERKEKKGISFIRQRHTHGSKKDKEDAWGTNDSVRLREREREKRLVEPKEGRK